MGKLGSGVAFDTNLLEALLQPKDVSPWLKKAMKATKKRVVFNDCILEYLFSPVTMVLTDYSLVKKRLNNMGSKVGPGRYSTSQATKLASEIAEERYRRLLTEPPVDNNETYERRFAEITRRSGQDLRIACEAYTKGFAFLTADAKFGNDFSIELESRKLPTHVIPMSWLRPSRK
ncbi:hypothetical protein Dda_7328 [Drechslerella dactyloides]|uniref:PIN domain-containing protein n=1 Tax=Drechslerella dactyloides TaxID=74499 RepID=A0AAD6NI83_DREDA|nr:hypothetical protein Dda_7328 [Drechslerella dactyloides]